MKFIRHLAIIISCLFIISGCHAMDTIPDGFYAYEKDKVNKAVEKLTFEPKLPTFIPVDGEMLVTDRFYMDGKEAFDMTIFTKKNAIFTVQSVNGKRLKDDKKMEKVTITDTTVGMYRDQEYSQSLQWEKNGISYQLTYRPDGEKLPIKKFIKVAASF